MALPFIAGAALGSLAVVAFNNKKEIKERVEASASKVKEFAKKSFKTTSEFAKETKDSVQDKIGCKKDEVEVAK
jgi:hypothetical protein